MDRKAKKKLDRLRQKLQRLQQRHAGAKRQEDEPGEAARLEREIQEVRRELDELAGS